NRLLRAGDGAKVQAQVVDEEDEGSLRPRGRRLRASGLGLWAACGESARRRSRPRKAGGRTRCGTGRQIDRLEGHHHLRSAVLEDGEVRGGEATYGTALLVHDHYVQSHDLDP